MTESIDSKAATVVTLNLDARADNVMLVRQALEGAAREIGAREQLLDDIKLAVTEACSNVVRYAYGGEAGPMNVAVGRADGTITITVSDFGSWRDENDSSDGEPSGMGIPIMQSVTASHEIRRRPGGTEVVLVFRLDGQID